MIFIVGFRGEPGVHDEPQHIFQGEITLKLLEVMNIEYFVLDAETKAEKLRGVMEAFKAKLAAGKQVAFVVCKGALSYDKKFSYANGDGMKREQIIKRIVEVAAEDIIVCTTGKASRELFEIREARGEAHDKDFLTVGSMGHSSSIALGIALQRSDKKIWCIDGDGAALMHMGAMAVIGGTARGNLVHIVINNRAHESVGGMPTVADKIDFSKIAAACGYDFAVKVNDEMNLRAVLQEIKTREGRCFIEIASSIGARADLGRPTVPPQKNKSAFMNFIAK